MSLPSRALKWVVTIVKSVRLRLQKEWGKRKLFSSYSDQLLLQNTIRYKKKLILNVLAGNDFVVILNNIHCGKWEESA